MNTRLGEFLHDVAPPRETGATGGTQEPSHASKQPETTKGADPIDRSHGGYDGIRELLGDYEPAPRREGGKGRIMSIEVLLNAATPAVLEKCLDGADFTAEEIRQAVPVLAAAYSKANLPATALGDGLRGVGLHLWRTRRSVFRACRENAVLAAKRMKPGGLEAAARKRGLAGVQELAQAIQRLPSVKPAGQS